jgi:predicted NBD/HSP70 family sugar kinase
MRHVVEQTVPFVANIVNTLDLPQVVLGGTATRQLGEPFIELYREMLSRLTLFPARVEKCRSEFAGIVGTAMIASNQQLKNIL